MADNKAKLTIGETSVDLDVLSLHSVPKSLIFVLSAPKVITPMIQALPQRHLVNRKLPISTVITGFYCTAVSQLGNWLLSQPT